MNLASATDLNRWVEFRDAQARLPNSSAVLFYLLRMDLHRFPCARAKECNCPAGMELSQLSSQMHMCLLVSPCGKWA